MSEPGKGLGTMSAEMRGAGRYYDWLADLFRPHLGRRVLEVGPGFGSLAERLEAEVYVGLDDSEEVAAELRRKFSGRAGFEAFVDKKLGADHMLALVARKLDTVVAVNVLEHVEDDSSALRLWSRLAPGGRLLLFVPAMPVLYGTLDAQAGHFRRYTRTGLAKLLADAGVVVERLSYFNAVGALGWFVSGRVLKQDLAGSGTGFMVKVYEKWILRVARWVDPLLRPFWGQSLVAVGRFGGTQ